MMVTRTDGLELVIIPDVSDDLADLLPDAVQAPAEPTASGARAVTASVRRDVTAGTLRTVVLIARDEIRALVPAWLALYARSDLGNANLHPAWVLAWYDAFIHARDVLVVAVYSADELVGVAPMWRMRLVPGTDGLSVLQPAGAGRHVLLSDTPGLLTESGAHRKVVKAVADRLDEIPGWSWYTMTLSPQQGWNDQLATPGRACVVPRVGRTCVISHLPSDQTGPQPQLKRNVRESIRRATNRLKRADGDWRVERTVPGSDGFSDALQQLITLHRSRAQLADRKHHRDVFHDERYARLLTDAAEGAGASDLMTIYSLRVGGRVLAAHVVLHAPTTSTLLVSGIHPDGWEFSPMAVIIREIMRDAVAAGRHRLNHSAGPDTGKLRWSETMETHPEFSIVRTGAVARAAFLAHTHLAVGASLRRERNRQGDAPAPTPTA
jgi:CelD/BcsL family acetyltransferase involved in cellulose biosynthesis